jgi:hypothetical protein
MFAMLRVWVPGFDPFTLPVKAKVIGETVKSAEASDRSAIAWAKTRQTVHTKIKLILKSITCTLCFSVPTVITPSG